MEIVLGMGFVVQVQWHAPGLLAYWNHLLEMVDSS
jgi:hypothetical protein